MLRWSEGGREIARPLKTVFISFFLLTVGGLVLHSAVVNYTHLREDLQNQSENAEKFLLRQEELGTRGLEQALTTLTQQNALFDAANYRRRDLVAAKVNALFAEMKGDQRVTEFTVYGPDLIPIARGHDVSGYPAVNRSSLIETAVASGKVARGLELGEFYTPVVAAVRPYFDANGKLVAVIRLAMSFEVPLRFIGETLALDLVEVLPASIVRPHIAKTIESWDLRNTLASRSARPEFHLSPPLLEWARTSRYDNSRGSLIRDGKRLRMVRAITRPLADKSTFLDILIIKDVTPHITSFVSRILIGLALATLLALVAGFIAFRMIQKLQATVAAAHDELERAVAAKTKALKDSESRLLEAQRITSLGSWERNLRTNEHHWSEEMYRITGLPQNLSTDAAYAALRRMSPEAEMQRIKRVQAQAIKTCGTFDYRYQFKRGDGQTRTLHVLGYVMAGEDSQPEWIIGTTHDVTEQYNAMEEGRWLSEILEASLNEIYVVDAETLTFDHANACALVNLQYGMEELIGLRMEDILADENGATSTIDLAPLLNGETQLHRFNGLHRRKDGTVYPVETHIQIHSAGGRRFVVAICNDISERVAREKETLLARSRAERLAYFDALTNLPNRAACQRDALIRFNSDSPNLPAFLLHLDIDNFKRINDTLGHSAGDACLEDTGERLRLCCAGLGTAYRWGGDEFVIIAQDDDSDLEELCERLKLVMRAPMEYDGQQIWPSVSIGAARSPEDGTDFDQLLVKADLALYNSKDLGKDRWTCFTGDLKESSDQEATLELDLRRAIRSDEFFLVYQPQVNLRTQEVTGIEALVRWQHPTRGVLSPGVFLPVIEKTNLAAPLGQMVIDKAVKAASELEKMNVDFCRMAVNLSPSHLKSGLLMNDFIDAMTRHGVTPDKLKAEVLESVFLDETSNHNALLLQELHDLGLHIELDDFGTGFASLTHVADLPINGLKIDRSFTAKLLTDQKKEIVINHLIHLARSLDINVVCEGVETDAQFDRLRMMGNFSVQGYLIARPMTFDHLTDWLASVQGDIAFNGV
ncbi:EAL domain-containing protein [Roseibium sp. CAU 1637]|uniref:EAL domain-containing protein n=1 Tax=Roseibium limicola TaxID=2816037 RepID=A0A939EPD6_9HYPH|nr:EAL domain-containing protein [Roseibium limicola]MBO0345870.1 EAL domain-containing protein [Roseibium limicola]